MAALTHTLIASLAQAINRLRPAVAIAAALLAAAGGLGIALGTSESSTGATDYRALLRTAPQPSALTAELTVSPSFFSAGGVITTSPDPFLSITFNQTSTLTQIDLDGVDHLANTVTIDNKVFIVAPSNLALGTHDLAVSAEDPGGVSSSYSWTFEVIQKPSFQLDLSPGWSLVSLPSAPLDPDVNGIFGGASSIDAVVTSSGVPVGETSTIPCNPLDLTTMGIWCQVAVRSNTTTFSGTLTQVEAGRGYWVHATSSDTIAVNLPGFSGGAAVLPQTVSLKEGWNLVGYLSLNDVPNGGGSLPPALPAAEYFSGLSWQVAYEFNAASSTFTAMTPEASGLVEHGRGYYVFLSEPGVLLPAPAPPPSISEGATVTSTQAVIPMSPGWNFVSMPGAPIDPQINSVLPASFPVDTVLTYDPGIAGAWLVAARGDDGFFGGTLTTIKHGQGYWMRATSFADLTVALDASAPTPTYTIYKGWNAVGVTVVDPTGLQDLDGDGQAAELPIDAYMAGIDWVGAYAFDPATGGWEGIRSNSATSTRLFKAGKGYWVYAKATGQFQPSGEPLAQPAPPAPLAPPPPLKTNIAFNHDYQALSDAIAYRMYSITTSTAYVYEGWLVSDDGAIATSTGVMPVAADGSVKHTYISPTGENLVQYYSKVMVTQEPVPDPDPSPSGIVAFSHQVPLAAMAHIRHLLSDWPEGSGVGILTNLKQQLEVAILHANLALSSTTLGDVFLHTHHVINIIEGANGPNYDISFGDPGNGLGVLLHASDRKHASFAVSAALGESYIVSGAARVEADGKIAEDRAIEARDQALLGLAQASTTHAHLLLTQVLGFLDAALNGLDPAFVAIKLVGGGGGAQQA